MPPAIYKSSVKKAAKMIGSAIAGAESALFDGQVEQEPAMTDRMLGRIEQALSNIEINGIVWKAKTLTDRGRNAQESDIGADFMGVLHVSTQGYHVKKGFLAQAKMIRQFGFFDARGLISQCERMLEISPVSYVFLYEQRGVYVVSANAVIAAGGDLDAVRKEKAQKFFEHHLECMIGDRSISSSTPEGLEDLLRKADVRRGILIRAASALYL